MRESDPVGPLSRGLQIMGLAGRADGPLRPADLVTATGLARSTVDRVVSTLTETGYLRTRGREVVAAPRTMEIGNRYLSAIDPGGLLARRAARLAGDLDESVSLAVPDRDGVRIVGQSRRGGSLAVAFKVGDLLPAEGCAQGPVFAAEWTEAQWHALAERAPAAVPALRARADAFRASGWSLDDQSTEPGLVAVAIPIRGPARTLALTVVSHTSRHSAESLHAHARPLLATCAADLEALLASPPQTDEISAAGDDAHGLPASPPQPDGIPAAGGDVHGPLATSPGAVGNPAAGGDAYGALKTRLGAEYLQSLDRGLAVLHAIGLRPDGLTISEAAAATGQPRATARRALLSLAAFGYAIEDRRRFALLPRVLDLGYRRVSGLTFEELARPHLRDLVVRVQDSASVVVLDGTDIRYVARAQASRLMRVEITIGTRLPAYATAMGRVLLAGLPGAEAADLIARSDRRAFTGRTLTAAAALSEAVATARDDGYAIVDQELETGLRSIAVPLHAGGRVVAALNIAAPAGREPLARMRERLLPELRATARALQADLDAFTCHQPLVL